MIRTALLLVLLITAAGAADYLCPPPCPPLDWQPPQRGTVMCGLYWDAGRCRYGCPPEWAPKEHRK